MNLVQMAGIGQRAKEVDSGKPEPSSDKKEARRAKHSGPHGKTCPPFF